MLQTEAPLVHPELGLAAPRTEAYHGAIICLALGGTFNGRRPIESNRGYGLYAPFWKMEAARLIQ